MKTDSMNSYARLVGMTLLAFLSMYLLMYAMVDRIANVLPNVNQFYMAALMTAPMVIIELLIMRDMYINKKLNALILIGSVLVAVIAFGAIRQQSAVSDEQFLKSMIPHHGAAILMCEQAILEDPDIQDLCSRILASQQAEIDEMKGKLRERK
ncbi:MAG TPA: DUF305 domain-containing protein [Candidatus Nanoarchaeia archaeon]|nr:DUF305 domain-containing protein [Candidatus Nanoarchaeia archaeon]